MSSLYFPIASFFICIFLNAIFFTKKNTKNIETNLFNILLIVNLVETILAIVIILISKIIGTISILYILNRFDFILISVWCSLLCLYIYYISKTGTKKFFAYFIAIVNILTILLLLILNFEIINEGEIINTSGNAPLLTSIICGFYLILMVFITIKRIVVDKNKMELKKYIPVLAFAILITLTLFLRGILPTLVMEPFMISFINLIMYHTIENPDVKMINQLLRNQELVEEQMEDKSRFLFEMSQDIKEPTNNILGLVNNYDNLNNEDKKEAIKIIGDNANELLFKLNNVLNVSSMDASKIKIVKEEYNPKILLNGIKSIATNAIGEKPIKLNFEVSNSLPDKLSGDDVRLKQIIMSIIYNCVNHTESGVINVNVDSIVRYDVARLMIKIEDTGIGMDLDTINRVLDDNQELDKVDIEKLDRLDVDLKVVVKIVKLLGGNFMIKSDKGRGSIFTIVLDQKCEMENLSNSKELEKYTSDAFGKKRVLVVDDSKEELFKISDILGKKDININTSMMGKECVDRIRSGEIYNLIIIDDELKITSGYNVLKELNSLEKFKIPVIIMLEKDKEYLKKHYIEDGFKDVILKEYLNDELERISNSYL